MSRSKTFFVLLNLFFFVFGRISLDSFPNPQNSFELCDNKESSTICDPDKYLNPNDKKLIKEKILNLNEAQFIDCDGKKLGVEIGIAIIGSFKEYDKSLPWYASKDEEKMAEIYARKIHDTWGVGHRQCNNGILIFESIADRVFFISTGSGVESYLTEDFISQYILDNDIKPYNRKRQYSKAILSILDTIEEVLKHSDNLDESYHFSRYKRLYVNNYLFKIPFFGYKVEGPELLIVGIISFFIGKAIYDEKKKNEWKKVNEKLNKLHAQAKAKKFNQESCPICLEDFNKDTKTVLLNCGHRFCDSCLTSWFNQKSFRNQKCPICRKHWNDTSNPEGDEIKDDNSNDDNNNNTNNNNNDNNNSNNDDINKSTFYTGNSNDFSSNTSTTYNRRNYYNSYRYRNDLWFRLRMLQRMYPRYIDNSMIHSWGARDYNYNTPFTRNSRFTRMRPTMPSRSSGSSYRSSGRRSGGFSFGGGRSSGGGGGRW